MAKAAAIRLVEGYNIEGTKLTIPFRDGAGQVSASLDEFSEDIRQQLAMFGLKTKLSNATRGDHDVAAARESIEGMISQLSRGEWRAERESGGGTGGRAVLDLVEAVCRIRVEAGKDENRSAIHDMVRGLESKERTALAKRGDVATKLAEIALERAQSASTEGAADTAAALFD